MSRKLGVYFCSGCSIGDSISVESLSKVAQGEYAAAVTGSHECLCSPESVERIRTDVRAGNVEAVALAACSPRAKNDAFRFDGRLVVERANLREHVVWSHVPRDENTQMLAEDCLRMALARAQKSEPPVATPADVGRRLLVVGGGITGLTAALEGAEAGYEVVLVEREASLGGALARTRRQFPSEAPFTELEDVSLD